MGFSQNFTNFNYDQEHQNLSPWDQGDRLLGTCIPTEPRRGELGALVVRGARKFSPLAAWPGSGRQGWTLAECTHHSGVQRSEGDWPAGGTGDQPSAHAGDIHVTRVCCHELSYMAGG